MAPSSWSLEDLLCFNLPVPVDKALLVNCVWIYFFHCVIIFKNSCRVKFTLVGEQFCVFSICIGSYQHLTDPEQSQHPKESLNYPPTCSHWSGLIVLALTSAGSGIHSVCAALVSGSFHEDMWVRPCSCAFKGLVPLYCWGPCHHRMEIPCWLFKRRFGFWNVVIMNNVVYKHLCAVFF